MDILISSNLERLLYHLTGDAARVAGWMAELAEKGCYTVDAETLARLQESFGCGWADDAQAGRHDPPPLGGRPLPVRPAYGGGLLRGGRTARHGAGGGALHRQPVQVPAGMFSPLSARVVPDSDFAAMEALTAATGSPAPESLRSLQQLPVRFRESLDPAAIRAAALR